MVPDVPVTVSVYCPVVARGLLFPPPPPPPDPPPPPPQLIAPPPSTISSMSMRRTLLPLRRIAPIPNNSKLAKANPPRRHRVPGADGGATEALLAAVVEIVRVAVWLLVSEMVTGVVAPKLTGGVFTAPPGELVTLALRLTLPVNPPVGVRVIVDVFPAVEPATTATLVPTRLMPGGMAVVTLTKSWLLTAGSLA